MEKKKELEKLAQVLTADQAEGFKKELEELEQKEKEKGRTRSRISRREKEEIVKKAYEGSERARGELDFLIEEINQVQENLSTDKEKIYNFLGALNPKALALIWYCWSNEYATIREFTDLVETGNDSKTLQLIKEINRQSRLKFGREILKFRERSFDGSGNLVTYAWWFKGNNYRHRSREVENDRRSR